MELERENFPNFKIWDYPGYIVRQQLIDTRGWTPELIDEFLQPDLQVPNPHNLSQQMRLYLQETVIFTEQLERFKLRFLQENAQSLPPAKRIFAIQQANKIKKKRDNNHHAARRRIQNRYVSEKQLLQAMSKV